MSIISCSKLQNTIDQNTHKFLHGIVSKMKTDPTIPKPSDYIQGRRYYPEGVTERYGPHDNSFVPHHVDILDWVHPEDPAPYGTVMKSTQAGITTLSESMMGFWIKFRLGSIIFVIATEEMAKIRASSNIDVMIDNTDDLKTHIDPHSDRNNKKTKDGTYKELTANRVLLCTSYNATSKIESVPYSFVMLSELDRIQYRNKGQLDPEASLKARTATKRIYKFLRESSPSQNATESRIYKAYLEGDQRQYHIPCPECGEFQILTPATMGRKYGLTFDFKKVKDKNTVIPESVRYICKYCHRPFDESKKLNFLRQGKWVPQFPELSNHHKSWHVSALISPVGFYSWARACQDWLDTNMGKDVPKLKDYIISVLGEPWHSRQSVPQWRPFAKQAVKMPRSALPKRAGCITMGADIQSDRIEVCVVAWGVALESWVIDYQVFHGNTGTHDNDVFKVFHAFCSRQFKTHTGKVVGAAKVAIDARYSSNKEGSNTQNRTIYDFCLQNNAKVGFELFAPVMGVATIAGNEPIKGVSISDHPIKKRYNVNTGFYKDGIFNMSFSENEEVRQYAAPIHFNTFSDDFFKGFFSEVLQEENGKWIWKKTFERNEPLDTYIYAAVAAEIYGIRSFDSQVWAEIIE